MIDCTFTMGAKTVIPFKVLLYFTFFGGGHLAMAIRKVTNIESQVHQAGLELITNINDLEFLILLFYHLYLNSSKCPNSAIL